ncbi:hypothetical protein BACCOPRO_00896 [Phocaeicola coprophilus DSM 18228 = JCM 13818]|uniref:Uncharacterized protein n=1 Tax=Phocaeicola coprophilus DSM 18228 = JCM 13818 TaxID=547042 RepID=S0F6V0_9BACT|nr:hypothetical protein BACCOPRO_00896 [Phocaeicola coprophilus DSM 18228 = JCM 13818]
MPSLWLANAQKSTARWGLNERSIRPQRTLDEAQSTARFCPIVQSILTASE